MFTVRTEAAKRSNNSFVISKNRSRILSLLIIKNSQMGMQSLAYLYKLFCSHICLHCPMNLGARRAHRVVYDSQRCRPEHFTDDTQHQRPHQLMHNAALMLEVLIVCHCLNFCFFCVSAILSKQ